MKVSILGAYTVIRYEGGESSIRGRDAESLRAFADENRKRAARLLRQARIAMIAAAHLAGESFEVTRCCKCKGLTVQCAVWIDPNTGETGEDFGSWDSTDTKFCADCDDNLELEWTKVDPLTVIP